MQANTNSVNKTWSLLQSTGGKDEPNIHQMFLSWCLNINCTRFLQCTRKNSFRITNNSRHEVITTYYLCKYESYSNFGAVIAIQWYGSWTYLCYQCLSITTKVVSLGFVLYTILCKFYALLKLANGSLHQYT
jgi:hypothetical protein